MGLKSKSGLTLIESLVSISLLSVLVIGVLGAFFISKTAITHARHRTVAMNLVREYLEKEISLGYYFGIYSQSTAVVRTVDGVNYTVSPYPDPAVVGLEGGVNYKRIGFRVTWNELRYGGSAVACAERAVTHVAQH